MSDKKDARDEWVHQVLGIDPATLRREATLVPAGTVAYRKALLGFAQAKTQVASQLDQLSAAIIDMLPEEAALAEHLSAELSTLNEEIAEAVDVALNASGAGDARTRAMLQVYVDRLAKHRLVEHVDANPFVPVAVRDTLTNALTDILAHTA